MKYIYALNAGRTAVYRSVLTPETAGEFYHSFGTAKKALLEDIEKQVRGLESQLQHARVRLAKAWRQRNAVPR